MEGGPFGVCKEIQAAPLTATDKLVGMVLALAMVKEHDFARMLLPTIMARTSLSERTVQKSIKNLESAGILHRVRTGRAAIYRFQTDKSRKIVEAENSAGQRRKILPLAASFQSPFLEGVGEDMGAYDEKQKRHKNQRQAAGVR